ncbi:MAG: hypothetical protein K6U79_10640 [Firmicutes bacterium]|nr:hypothetical protein [Bacillota bacterium]
MSGGEARARLPEVALVTRDRRLAERYPGAFLEVKDVSGLEQPPLAGAHAMISCFGDNRLAAEHPDWVQVDERGLRATREASFFDWDSLCPSRPEVQERLLDRFEEVARSGVPGLRLDDVDYAREGFCRCEHCRAEYERARGERPGLQWLEWRAGVLTGFTRRAVERIERASPGPRPLLTFTLYPDPLPAHQFERFGVDLAAVAPLVDAFVVPLYDLAYTTTYWLETIAWDFLEAVEAPLLIELYALHVEEKRLAHAVEVAARYADGLLFAYEYKPERIERELELGREALARGRRERPRRRGR